MDKTSFVSLLKENNVVLNENHQTKFEEYFKFLIEENAKYNLTSITNYEEVLEKHFFDSLSLSFKEINGDVLDVGSGGGFPGMPNAIYNKNIHLTVLDSTAKKINFINTLSIKLGLDIDCVVTRAEEYKAKQFDYVVARGVASLNVLLELCCDLVKENGIVIAMKGSKYNEELQQAKQAINVLGYEFIDKLEYKLPGEDASRCNLYFKKVKPHQAKYPRSYANIKKKPL